MSKKLSAAILATLLLFIGLTAAIGISANPTDEATPVACWYCGSLNVFGRLPYYGGGWVYWG